MELLIQNFIDSYGVLALFFGAPIFAEALILVASALAAEGFWSYTTVFGVVLVSMVLSDIVWFVLGDRLVHWMHHFRVVRERIEPRLQKLKGRTIMQQWYYLLFFKFIYGVRILTILYVGAINMNFWRFMLLNTIGTGIWIATVMLVGGLIAEGVAAAGFAFHSIRYTLGAVVIFFIVFHLVRVIIHKTNGKPEDEEIQKIDRPTER